MPKHQWRKRAAEPSLVSKSVCAVNDQPHVAPEPECISSRYSLPSLQSLLSECGVCRVRESSAHVRNNGISPSRASQSYIDISVKISARRISSHEESLTRGSSALLLLSIGQLVRIIVRVHRVGMPDAWRRLCHFCCSLSSRIKLRCSRVKKCASVEQSGWLLSRSFVAGAQKVPAAWLLH